MKQISKVKTSKYTMCQNK